MIALVLAVAIAALTFVVGTVTAERAEVRESLRRLEGYQIQDVRDQEMLVPITERVFAPLFEGLTSVARRFTPSGFGEGIAQKLVYAGSPANLNVDKILVFKLLGMSDEEAKARFGFFVDALEYGTPPHGGIALGLDRIVAIMAGESSIREVIAFPKTANALDLIAGAPSTVDAKQLRELHLRIQN